MTGATERIGVAVIGAGLMGSQIGCEYALAGHRVVFVARDADRARRGSATRSQPRGASPSPTPDALEQGAAADQLPRGLRGRRAGRADRRVAGRGPRGQGRVARRRGRLAPARDARDQQLLDRRRRARRPRRRRAAAARDPLLEPAAADAARRGARRRGDRAARVDRVCALLRAIGKRPVRLEREAPGLLWNRIQLAVLREALWLVEHGVASPAVIDEVMRDGLARRWRLTGPFETVSLGGAATFDAVAANLFPTLSDAREAKGFGPHLIDDAQALAALRERRDEGLAAELARERGAAGD